MMRVLLEAGAETNLVDSVRCNAVRCLLLERFLLYSTFPDSQMGWTAIQYAADNKHIESTEILIDAGADLDLANRDGNTALHLAAQGGHAEVLCVRLKECG